MQNLFDRRNQERYSCAGRLHTVGHRKLHIHVTGQSDGPTIVFDHDCEFGASSLNWHMVAERVQHFAKVVTFDRSGYGWSDGGSYPRTNLQNVEDLRQLLLAENIKGPVILVGHGYGAVNARLFAHRYPKQVSGLIFVEAWHEEERTGRFPEHYISDLVKVEKRYKRYITLAHFGWVKILLSLQASFRKLVKLYPPLIAKKVWALASLKKTTKAISSEYSHQDAGYNQIRNVSSYKNIPITVIIGGKMDDVSPETKQAKYDVANELKNLSEEGLLIVAPNSGRHVPIEQPEMIADAIRRMINRLKTEYV